MTIRNDLLEKKKQLEFQIKMAIQKFMDETGLMITEISASNQNIGGISGHPSDEELDKRQKESLMHSLEIKIRL